MCWESDFVLMLVLRVLLDANYLRYITDYTSDFLNPTLLQIVCK